MTNYIAGPFSRLLSIWCLTPWTILNSVKNEEWAVGLPLAGGGSRRYCGPKTKKWTSHETAHVTLHILHTTNEKKQVRAYHGKDVKLRPCVRFVKGRKMLQHSVPSGRASSSGFPASAPTAAAAVAVAA